MDNRENIEKILVPYFGQKRPNKAKKQALDMLSEGGKLFLLHIVDEAPTRSIRYQTGQMGEESEIIKTFKETLEKVQEKHAKEYTDNVKKEASQKGIEVISLQTTGDPAQEVIKVIKKYSIQLVLIEQLREKLTEVLLGDEIEHLCENAPCKIMTA